MSIPFCAQVFTRIIASTMSSIITRHTNLSYTVVVKIFNSIGKGEKVEINTDKFISICLNLGTFGSAAALFALSMGSCYPAYVSITLLCTATSINVFDAAGFRTSLVNNLTILCFANKFQFR
jgi:hypothetical protein